MDGAQILGEAPSSWSVYFAVEDTDADAGEGRAARRRDRRPGDGHAVRPARRRATDATGAVFKLVG